MYGSSNSGDNRNLELPLQRNGEEGKENAWVFAVKKQDVLGLIIIEQCWNIAKLSMSLWTELECSLLCS